MSPSSTRLAITCIIFVSLFCQHQCKHRHIYIFISNDMIIIVIVIITIISSLPFQNNLINFFIFVGENVDGYEQNKLFIPPCIGLHRHHISFRPDSYCCDGKNKFCSPIKEECWHQCAILNPRPSSSQN